MREGIFDSYMISQLQLDILLNSMECNEIYGIERRYDKENVDRAKVYVEINRMISDGFITVGDNKFIIDSKVKECLRNMADAEHIVHLYAGSGSDYLCYLNPVTADIVSFSNIRDRISVTQMSVEEFKNIFLEEILPDDMEMPDESADTKTYIDRENELIELSKAGVMDYRVRFMCGVVDGKSGEKRCLYGFNSSDLPECNHCYVADYTSGIRRISAYNKKELIAFISEYGRRDYGDG